MLTTVRLHSFTDDVPAEWGDTTCDFRGNYFVGDPIDGHKTLIEFDVDDSSPEGQAFIQFVLAEGPNVNTFTQSLVTKVESLAEGVITSMAGILGVLSPKLPNLRWGVWDKTPPSAVIPTSGIVPSKAA